MQKTSAIIINIPHASTVIPETEKQYYVTDALQREIDVMTDHFTDDLFDAGEDRIIFPVSRLVCDVERFRSDAEESMSKKGMGAIYTSCHDFSALRVVSRDHKEHLLKSYYDPYHREFENRVKEKLECHGCCLIVDGHSFPAVPLPYENDQNTNRPDICIGTDEYHTPPEVQEALCGHFRKKGYEVAVNEPFAGAIVPMRFYRQDKRVKSVMIEINRGLYMDQDLKKKAAYKNVKRDVLEAIELLKLGVRT